MEEIRVCTLQGLLLRCPHERENMHVSICLWAVVT